MFSDGLYKISQSLTQYFGPCEVQIDLQGGSVTSMSPVMTASTKGIPVVLGGKNRDFRDFSDHRRCVGAIQQNFGGGIGMKPSKTWFLALETRYISGTQSENYF